MTPQEIDAIKSANPIAGVIGRYVKLTLKGHEYSGLCPFHQERSPSLIVYAEEGAAHCFGCGWHGDVIGFVMQRQGLAFPEACRALADGTSLPAAVYQPPPKPKGRTAKPDDSVLVMPVPDDAPRAVPKHALGPPAKVWDYNDAEGRLLYRICRFNKPDGSKEFAPLTWRQGASGAGRWRWKSVPALRPIYGLDRLAARPGAPVIVCEGEKTADAARILFPDMVAVSWPGGSKAVVLADWSALEDRRVMLWPDADEPGIQAMSHLAPILFDIARRVEIITPPADAEKGWDAADATKDEAVLLRLGAQLWLAPLPPSDPLPAQEDDTPPWLPGDDAPPPDAPARGGGVAVADDVWTDTLILNDARSGPRALVANAIIALREASEWTGVLWYDVLRQRTVMRAAPPWMEGKLPSASGEEAWNDQDDIRTAQWLQLNGIYVSPDIAGQAVEIAAHDRRFHPVLEYLDRCEWDGVPRIDTWAIDHLGAEDTPYVRAASSCWLVGAIARVTEPGCKADCALILEGDQGLLKSTALKTLGQPWFTDEIADLGTKDASLQLAGTWIIELAELDSMQRGDVSKIKAFMSRATDRFRPPYGKRVIDVPRQCVFAGTVNGNEYLKDTTGGRRFWPIACTAIDIPKLTANRDRLWAEARHRYLAGEKWWFDTDALVTEAAKEQRARLQSDVWQDTIADYLAGKSETSIDDILRHAIKLGADQCGKINIGRWKHADENRAAACLRALDWERRQRWDKETKKRPWRYRPKSSI